MNLLDNIFVKVIFLFVTSFLADWCFTIYIRRSGEGKALKAAIWGTLIAVFGSVNVISYTQNHYLLIPILIGYFLGTYYAVDHDHQKSENAKTNNPPNHGTATE